MATNRDSDTALTRGGRSGNDYLQRGGEGYQSWGAEGPSGVTATGGVGSGGAQNTGARSFTDMSSTPAAPVAQPSRTAARPALSTLLVGVGIGAALMYFLDPGRGARRRHVAADKALSVGRDLQRAMRNVTRDSTNRVRGTVAELRGQMSDEQVDDDRLVARVRSELGHHVEHARPIEVVAEGGVVTLRGHVAEGEVPEVVAAVEKVRGVQRVENLLVVQPQMESAPSPQV